MPTPKIKTPIEFDHCYHIFNRGNNKEPLFYTKKNYNYFLEKLDYYLSDYIDLYAYCLIPNHFHFLIRARTDNVSSQFQRFFQAYALSINFQENRSGSLFQKTFRRILIEDNVYLKWLVFYIHHNPEKHFVVKDYKRYKYSSYRNFLSGSRSLVNKEDVFDWFGGKTGFIDYHQFSYEQKGIEKDKGCEPGSQPSDRIHQGIPQIPEEY